ncbi:MAG: hypothetical protein NTV86_04915 [Planctomycetota bacterium]|nr:hypothetical protein [Planctomycetota bacterium]
MTKAEAVDKVIESLRQFIGDKDLEIDGDTQPIGGLGLESQDGIAWAVDLENFGFQLPDDLNPLVDDERHKARSVDEIADLLQKYIR